MAPHDPWRRYDRDNLEDAWHAIDDLRDRVEELEVLAAFRRHLFMVMVGVGTVVMATVAVASFILEVRR